MKDFNIYTNMTKKEIANLVLIDSIMTSNMVSNSLISIFVLMTLVDNNTDINFKTSDTPVFNLKYREDETALEYRIPISPKKLLQISYKKLSDSEKIFFINKFVNSKDADKKPILNHLLFRKDMNNIDDVIEQNNIMNANKECCLIAIDRKDLEVFIDKNNEV